MDLAILKYEYKTESSNFDGHYSDIVSTTATPIPETEPNEPRREARARKPSKRYDGPEWV
jgi:hypothetical protein